jgi:TfoX/Sxy family transcriptional regulator of competence genes
MAYDEELGERIRVQLASERGVTEKRMFGGLAFLINGNMAVSASGQGGLLLRVDPARSDALLREPDVERAVMRGRPMDGWLRVAVDAETTEPELARWIGHGVGYARSLPPK